MLFLASDLAGYVTGQTLVVDGGVGAKFPYPMATCDSAAAGAARALPARLRLGRASTACPTRGPIPPTWRACRATRSARRASRSGVRLELVGDAEAVEIDYRTDDRRARLPRRGRGHDLRRCARWRARRRAAAPTLGDGTVRLAALGAVPTTRGHRVPARGHAPDGASRSTAGGGAHRAGAARAALARVRRLDRRGLGGVAGRPAPGRPSPARPHGLDVVNLGYAGAARGEIVSAEQIAALDADVISIAHGTNCWTRIPFTARRCSARRPRPSSTSCAQGHPDTPIVVASPVLRPDAEDTPEPARRHPRRPARRDGGRRRARASRPATSG